MSIAIIQYNAGNTCSVQYAFQRLGVETIITSDKEEIIAAERVVFPGVGSAGAAMQFLRESGLDMVIPGLKQPVLGICLGMQLFCELSEEENTTCLGIVKTKVKRFENVKLPHVGWNQASAATDLNLAINVNDEYFYYVHSYYVPVGEYTLATTDYGDRFTSVLKKDNFYGVQFHPEKSSVAGEKLLQQFVSL